MDTRKDVPPVLKLYTLHYPGATWFKSHRAAFSLEEAVAAWGGEFVPRAGGICGCSSDPNELGTCGTLRFAPHLFRPMDDIDVALGASLNGATRVYTEGGLGLAAGSTETVELIVREHNLLYDPNIVAGAKAA